MNSTERLIQQEDRFSGRFNQSVVETLKLCFWPYRYRVAFLCSIGFLGRLLLLGNANLIGLWVDSTCRGPNCGAPPKIFGYSLQNWNSGDFLLTLSLAVGIGFVLTLIFRTEFSKISALAVSELYDETTLRTSRVRMSYFDRTPVGRLVTRFSSDYGNVFRLFGGPLAEFLSILFDLTCMIILSIFASPLFLPLILFMAFLDYRIFRKNQERLRSCRRELSASRSPAVAHFSETAQGASTIRTFNRTAVFAERFARLDQYCLDQKRNTVLTILRFSVQLNSLTVFLVGGAGALALFGSQTGWISPGDTGVFFAFTALSGFSIQSFFEWLNQVEEALVGVERMDHLLRMPIEPMAFLPATAHFETGHPKKDSTHLSGTKKSEVKALDLNFNDLWFRYAEELPWVLKGLSLKIKAGEKIGIVGRTGAGKSSIVQALFHFYPIEKGQIQIGDLSFEDVEDLRRQISFISQDTVLFRGSLRENLDATSSHPDIDLIEALRVVGLDRLASAEGLEFEVEERGRNLSAGEKQLLCIARCLLQESPIVVLDEATSSIDPQSEELVIQASKKVFEGKTQLIIAHRLSTISHCDRVLWLEGGRVKMFAEPGKVIEELRQLPDQAAVHEVIS